MMPRGIGSKYEFENLLFFYYKETKMVSGDFHKFTWNSDIRF